MTAPRYVVIGAGAIGALLAAQFELAGIDTVLVARGRNLAAIRENGLLVRRPQSSDRVAVPVVGGPEELRLSSRDVLVLTTKTQDAEEVLARWAWQPVFDTAPDVLGGEPTSVAADLPILTFQNGLATEDLALRRFRRVYAVSIGVAASYLVPGEVVSPSYPVIGIAWLGRYPGQPSADGGTDVEADGYVRDLTRAGYRVDAVADISAWKARKLLGNVGNGLDLLPGEPEQKARARALLVAEAAAVLEAAGIRTPAQAPPLGGDLVVEPVPGHVGGRFSTWQSFARGASSEADYLNGEIVRLGRLHGVATDVNERLQRLLGALSVTGEDIGAEGLEGLLALGAAPVRPPGRHSGVSAVSAVLAELGDAATGQPEALQAVRGDRSGWLPAGAPLALVRARTVEDVQRTLAVASRHGLPVITRGAGSGLAGAATAGSGTIVLDLSGMDRILEIDPVDGVARVEPGVITADLDRAAGEHGLFYAPDPGSVGISTVGGNIATNAGGLRGAKYGVTRDAVLALDVVLADGTLVHLGHETIKGVVGLDLVGLVVGSEGTLAVVVGATLRLLPRPVRVATAAAFFDSIAAGAKATIELATAGLRPTVIELVDGPTLAAIDDLRGSDLAAQGEAFLLVQTDGFGAEEEIDQVADVLRRTATAVRTTLDPAEALALSAARRDALPALEARGRVLIEDIAVPRSALAAALGEVQAIAADTGVQIYVFAHAGDGNLHPIIVLDPDAGPGIPAAAQDAADRIFALALSLGGTVSAEHGIGVLKRDWVQRELGPDTVGLHRKIKQLFDPLGLLNPEKAL